MRWFALSLAVIVVYVAVCCIWPFANCRRCKGSGKSRSPWGDAYRRCGRCKGSGERVRVGRRMWTWWAETYSKGTK